MRDVICFLCVLIAAAANVAAAEPKVGDVIYKADFDSRDALKEWQSSLAVEGGNAWIVAGTGKTPCLQIQAPKAPGQKMRIALPARQIAGLRLGMSAMIKAKDVAAPAQRWQGVKFMIYTRGPSGQRWQSPSELNGTFDFKAVTHSALIPADITEAWLDIGIEATSGTAWFDDIRISVAAIPRKRPEKPAPQTPLDRRTELPRLRGVMHGPMSNAENINKLAEWNVNLIRWQLHWVPKGKHDPWRDNLDGYDKWLDETLDHIDTLLPLCEKHGIKVLLDLHTPPGGGINLGAWPLFQEKRYQDHFIKTWDRIVQRYKNNKTIWGYDLANEPIEGSVAEGLMDWRTLALTVAQRIHEVDSEHALVIAPGPSGGWENLAYMEPLPVPGVIYSPHMYVPGEFTHQGVHSNPTGVTYPGEIRGKKWDKEALRKALEPVRQYQLDYNVPIYMGEFSAIRWAPGDSARQWLSDVIDIFEEYGWDWSYHAFREWEGWSIEHDTNPNNKKPATQPTSRQKLMLEWFGKNKRDIPAAK